MGHPRFRRRRSDRGIVAHRANYHRCVSRTLWVTATFENLSSPLANILHAVLPHEGRASSREVSTLRFLFKFTLRRHEIVEQAHFIHEPRKLPVVRRRDHGRDSEMVYKKARQPWPLAGPID